MKLDDQKLRDLGLAVIQVEAQAISALAEQINDQWQLKAENPAYADIVIHDELELVIWGVVTNVIHAL